MGYQNGQAIPPTDLQVMSPAGGIYSTANDMAKFMSLFFRDNVTAGTGVDSGVVHRLCCECETSGACGVLCCVSLVCVRCDASADRGRHDDSRDSDAPRPF